jgi:ubiquinone biosynthesis protein COQ9
VIVEVADAQASATSFLRHLVDRATFTFPSALLRDVMVGQETAMLDPSTPKGRIISAAFECAAAKPWGEVTLLDIGEAAKLSLTEVRDTFAGKADILAAFLRAVDDEVLKRIPKAGEGQDRRDALFDVVMTRFDVLAPYKAAIKSIHASGPADVTLARPFLASQHWMLQGAGIGTDGASGALRVAGLSMIYASVFGTWLEDDDPGLARTMAALDRRLRRGERTLRGVEQVGTALYRLASEGPGFIRSTMRGRTKPEPTTDAAPGTGA